MRKRRRKTWNQARLARVKKYHDLLAAGESESEAIRKSGFSPKDIRSRKFWKEKYAKIRRWAAQQGLDPDERVGSMDRFISLYTAFVAEAEKNKKENPHIMRDIQYVLRYKAGYETVLAERQFLRSLEQKEMEEYRVAMAEYNLKLQDYQAEGEADLEEPEMPQKPKKHLSVAELKEMTTSEFAEMYAKELRDMYYRAKQDGMTVKQAKNYISAELFGSP